MAQFNFNAVRGIASTGSADGREKNNFAQNASILVFAGLLIVCSLAVGCSSEKPKNESSNNQSPMAQMTPPAVVAPPSVAPTPVPPLSAKPVRKKVVRRAPPAMTYADKISGVSFQYPRKYSLKTGEGANELVSKDPTPMGFVQPGGVAVAAVVVPEGMYPKSDLASAFFDVSVNKTLTAEQCSSFPAGKENTIAAQGTAPTGAAPEAATTTTATPTPTHTSKLMIGDLELQSSETVTSLGNGKEASRYYHVFENGACYELALKVATTGEIDEGGKAVDRDEVFKRLGTILATVKINSVKGAEVTASVPTAAAETPAQ
jgi:hypothetical protein